MSFFERRGLTNPGAELFANRRGNTYSGAVVNSERALRHSAVWGCLSVISEAVMQLPVEELHRTSAGVQRKDPPRIFFEPQPGIPWESWIWQQTWTLAARGRCYGLITNLDSDGYPTEIVPVPEEVVEWKWDRQQKRWRTFICDEIEKREEGRWPVGRLWHCPLYPVPGVPMGLSPVKFHAETIGVGLAAQEFGARFFGDGGHPTAIFYSDKKPSSDGGAERSLKDKLLSIVQGTREPIVLPLGTKMERWQIAPEESQFLDTMRYSGEDVCRIWGVPPGKVWLAISGQNVTYTNTSDANTDWRSAGLSRYTRTLEAHLTRLTPAGPRRRIRLNYGEFLRPTPGVRFQNYQIAAEIGQIAGTPLMQVNEMRAEEGWAPLEGGDTFARVQPAQPTREA